MSFHEATSPVDGKPPGGRHLPPRPRCQRRTDMMRRRNRQQIRRDYLNTLIETTLSSLLYHGLHVTTKTSHHTEVERTQKVQRDNRTEPHKERHAGQMLTEKAREEAQRRPGRKQGCWKHRASTPRREGVGTGHRKSQEHSRISHRHLPLLAPQAKDT